MKKITEEERRTIRETKAKHRYNRQQSAKEHMKYSVFHQVDRPNKNKIHSHFDGKVFRTDDPYLYAIYPPNCDGCQCTMSTLSERQLNNKGLQVEDVNQFLSSLITEKKLTLDDIKQMQQFDPRKPISD